MRDLNTSNLNNKELQTTNGDSISVQSNSSYPASQEAVEQQANSPTQGYAQTIVGAFIFLIVLIFLIKAIESFIKYRISIKSKKINKE